MQCFGPKGSNIFVYGHLLPYFIINGDTHEDRLVTVIISIDNKVFRLPKTLFIQGVNFVLNHIRKEVNNRFPLFLLCFGKKKSLTIVNLFSILNQYEDNILDE